jgi:hypothetical protein
LRNTYIFHCACRFGDNFQRNSHDRDTAFNPEEYDPPSATVPNWDFPDRNNYAQQCGAMLSGNFKQVRASRQPASDLCQLSCLGGLRVI